MSDIRAGKAFVEIGIKESLEKGLRNASNKLRAFGASVGTIGASIGAAGAAIMAPLMGSSKQFASMGDALDKMSPRVGTSVEFLSRLNHAANLGGTSIAEMEVGIRRLQRSAYDAAHGTKSASDAFRELGVNIKANDGGFKSTEQLFIESADALSKVENNTKKAALATIIFGRAGTKLLPMLRDGKDGLMAAMKEADALGITMSTEDAAAAAVFTDQMFRLKEQIKTVVFQLGAAVAGPFGDFIETAGRIAKTVIDWAKKNRELVATVMKFGAILVAVGAAVTAIGTAIAGVGIVVGGLATLVSVLGTVFAAVFSPIGVMVAAVAAGIWVFRERIVSLFAPLKELWAFAQETFQGIAAAIQAGDIELAWKIVVLSLEAVWVAAIERLKSKWFDVKEAIVSMWIDGVAKIKQIWIKAYTTIAKGLAWIYAKLTGQDAEQMMAIVAENAGYEIAGVEDKRQEKQNQLADDMEKQRHAELAALEKRRKAILMERKNAIQTAKEKLEAAKKATEEEMQPPPDAAFDVPTAGPVAALTSVEYGTAAFEKFNKNRENLEQQMVNHLAGIEKNTANAPMIAEAT